MPIEISILYSPDNVELSQTSLIFPDEGGTLGRSSNNFWSLQDPNKYMSSIHAKIECVAGQYYLTDKSTNGTFINGSIEPVGNSNQVALMMVITLRLVITSLLLILNNRQQSKICLLIHLLLKMIIQILLLI